MKFTFSLIAALLCLTTLKAQTVKDAIQLIPEEVIAGLTAAQKTKLCSEPATDTVRIENALNGEIIRLSLTDDYVCLQTSDAGTTQIKVLPLVNDSKILCVIKTVCSDICDSRISFYTQDWKPLAQQNLMPKRTFKWFLSPSADQQSDAFKEAIKVVDINPMVYTLSGKDCTLSVESDIVDYLGSEDYDELKPFLVEKPKVFIWDKISFKEKK